LQGGELTRSDEREWVALMCILDGSLTTVVDGAIGGVVVVVSVVVKSGVEDESRSCTQVDFQGRSYYSYYCRCGRGCGRTTPASAASVVVAIAAVVDV
jgi:hypothetical protein